MGVLTHLPPCSCRALEAAGKSLYSSPSSFSYRQKAMSMWGGCNSTITHSRKWSQHVPNSLCLAGFSMAQKPSGECESVRLCISPGSQAVANKHRNFSLKYHRFPSHLSLCHFFPLFPLASLSFLIPKVILSALNTCKWHLNEIKQALAVPVQFRYWFPADGNNYSALRSPRSFLSPRGAQQNCLPLGHLEGREKKFTIKFVLNKFLKAYITKEQGWRLSILLSIA